MKTALMILLGLTSLVLIVAITLQPSKSEGLGSGYGSSEAIFGKKKAKGIEALLEKVTIVGGVVLLVATLILLIIE